MMGDSSGGGTVKIEPNTESDDWRAGMTNDMRKGSVNMLYGMLKKKVPASNPETSNYIASVALGCEEKLFQKASKKENYIAGLRRKIEMIERLDNADIRLSTSTSVTGLSQNSEPDGADISSSLQNAFQLLPDLFGKMDGQQDSQINVSVTQMQTSRVQPLQQVAYQQCQQQELQHQLFKHNGQQQTSGPGHVHLNNNNLHFHQQEKHIVCQPSQVQCPEQMILAAPLHGRASGQQSNANVFHQNQQLNRQNNLSLQQQSMLQKNGEYFFEQPLNPQSNYFGDLNMQNMVGPQSNASNLQSHQHSSQILQHTEVTSLPPKFQQPMQGIKLEPVLGSQKQNVPSHLSIQQRARTSVALHQPQNVFDQQKPFQSQGVFSKISSEPSAASESAKDADYDEQTYQKIQSLKKQYQLHLESLHEKFKFASQKETRVDVSEKYKKNMLYVEKMLRFLSMSRIDIIRYPRMAVDRFYQEVKIYLTRVLKNSASNDPHVQVKHPADGQSLISQQQQLRDLKLQFNTENSALRSNVIGSNMFCSVPYDSHAEMGKSSELSMLQLELDQNTSGASAESNISCNVGVNAFDSAAKNPSVQPQHLKGHVQPQWLLQKKQQVLMQNNHLGFGTGMTNPLAYKPLNSPDHMLLLRTPTQLHASSLPMFQHSCPPSDQKNLSPLSNTRLPLHSATSPLAIPAPSSPLNRSSVARAKNPSGVSPLSISESNCHSQTSVSSAQDMVQNQVDNHSLSIGISDISASPLPTDTTGPGGEQQSQDTMRPIERLIKAVESMSRETLCAALQDIASVVHMVDRPLQTEYCSDAAGATVDDSLNATSCCTQVDSSSNREFSLSNKIKRKISATAFDAVPSFLSEIDVVNQQSDPLNDLDSIAVLKPRRTLLDEIRSINQRLIETVIDLDSTEAGEGTIVRCSYNPVAFSGYVKPHVSSQWSMLPLVLFIPASYPKSSPVIFDELSTVNKSSDRKEDVNGECNDNDLSTKAKERFSMSLRKLSGPVSLEEMARTWDKCARTVFSEYMQQFGGECFSSIYGSWEDC